jgi:predicted Fe-Mo cluster-binding NifX family protein
MRIAIPLPKGRLSQHFGHSGQFLLVDTDSEKRTLLHRKIETATEDAPGLLPRWLTADKRQPLRSFRA